MLANPTNLYYFLEISKTLNISRAAERLGITQPTLTQSLKKLEQHLKTELFIRQKSGLILTRTGQKLIPAVQELVLSWHQIDKISQEENGDDYQGIFHLGCHPAVGSYVLPRFFEVLNQKSPRISFKTTFDLSRKITEKIVSYELDFAFVINPYPHPDLVIKKLSKDLVHLWKNKKNLSTTLFADTNLQQTQSILKKIKRHGIQISSIIHIPDLFVLESLISHGNGYVILPEKVIPRHHRGRIEKIEPNHLSYQDELSLIFRREKMNSKSSKFIISEISNLFKD